MGGHGSEGGRQHHLNYTWTLRFGIDHTSVRAKSCLSDTSFETSFRHRKKYLAEVLSFGPCNSECIRSKNAFQIIFGGKKIFLDFLKFRIFKMYIVSRLRDTITET